MNNLLRDVTDEKGEKAVLQQVTIDGKTDLYTMGLILFEVLTGKIRAQTSQPPIEINNAVPQKLNDLTLGLLGYNIGTPGGRSIKQDIFSREINKRTFKYMIY